MIRTRADFERVLAAGQSFAGMTIEGVVLDGVEAEERDFARTTWRNVIARGASFAGSIFTSAELVGVDFRWTRSRWLVSGEAIFASLDSTRSSRSRTGAAWSTS